MNESTSVGSIVGYLSLNRQDWTRGVDETRRDADRLGRLSPSIRIQTNSGEVVGQLALVQAASDKVSASGKKAGDGFKIGLIPALLAIAPAAVPIAGVASGALLGLLPVAATVALGIKGISNEFKSGALDGTQYGSDIHALQGELTQLQTIAAGGILNGVDQALKSSQGLFPTINSDVQEMSNQLGSIVAGAGPALLQILTDLNPLFTTFGTLLTNGAQHLEAWANSSTGVQSFVAYVQAELPQVMTFLGEVITLFSHLAQGAAPFGGVLLNDINLFVGALDKIPVDVLRVAIPLAVSLYVAMKAYQGISAIVTGVSSAVNAMKAPFVTSATAAEAASLATQAAVAEEAAAVAVANAAMATSAAESAAAIAAATAGTTSILSEGAAAAALAAAEEAVAFQAAADAALASAAEISAAAESAAAASAAAGETAAVGWAGMAGPVGAAIVGVGLLATTLLHSSSASKDAAAAADSYATSVKSSTDALNSANIAQTNANLAKKGAFSQLDALHSGNQALGVSYKDLTTAVNGSDAQFQSMLDTLGKSGLAGIALVGVLKTQRTGLQDQIVTQTQLNTANAASLNLNDSQAASAAKLYGLVGQTGVAAYLAAVQAEKKSTDAAKAQTLAWQLENEGGQLLQQTLDKLAGKQLGYAQAQNQFEQSLVSMTKHTSKADAALTGLTSSAIQNRGDLLNLVTSAENTADAYGKMTGSTDAARTKLISLRQQIIDNAVAHGENRAAVTAYIDTVLKIPAKVTTDMLTKTDKAVAAIAALQLKINNIKQGKVPGLDADTLLARERIQNLQDQIDRLHGKSINVAVNMTGVTGVNGGQDLKVTGHAKGTGSVDDGWFTMGEQGYELGHKQGNHLAIYSHDQSVKMTGKSKVPGYAGGTGGDVVSLTPGKTKSKSSGSSSSGSNASGPVDFNGLQYGSLAAAENALARAVTLTRTDLSKFSGSLGKSAASVQAAEAALVAAAKQAGVSNSVLTLIAHRNVTLAREATQRDAARSRLSADRSNIAGEKSRVTGAYLGSFDLPTATGSFDSLFAQASQKANTAKKAAAGLKQLAKEGLGMTLVQQLAEAGPDAWPEIQALLSATPAKLKSFNTVERSLVSSGASAGAMTGNLLYGGAEARDAKAVATLNTAMAKLGKTIASEVAKAIDNRQEKIVFEPKGVAKLVIVGNKQLARNK